MPAKHFTNVYKLDRECGGPEEGGWWFTTYEPVYYEAHFTDGFAYFRAGRLEEQYPRNGNSSSVNYHSKPDDFTILVEPHPPVAKPEEHPHYE